MTDQTTAGTGAEFEREPSTDSGGEVVDSTTAVVTFGTGSSVSVSVSIPENDPPLESLSVYGASDDTNPSSDPENEIAESAQRPPSGQLAGTAAATPSAPYTVQLKFWYRGQSHNEPATILTGTTSTSGTITLSA